MILSLDQGTTSSRAILFDAVGRVCGVEQQAFLAPSAAIASGWHSLVSIGKTGPRLAGPSRRNFVLQITLQM